MCLSCHPQAVRRWVTVCLVTGDVSDQWHVVAAASVPSDLRAKMLQ